MTNKEFDQRYPAMFQPGGEDHVPIFVPLGTSQESAPAPSGRKTPADIVAPADGVLDAAVQDRTVTEPRPDDVDAGDASSTDTGRPDSGLADPGLAEAGPATSGPAASTLAVPKEAATPSVRWNAKAWVMGLSAIVVTFAASVFCLLAAFLIPSARSVDPSGSHGIMVQAWGYAIIPGAPALAAATLAMLAVMLLLGSRHYGSPAEVSPPGRLRVFLLWGGSVVVGLVTIGVGAIGLFGTALFPELYFDPSLYAEGAKNIPWAVVLQMGAATFLPVGLALVAAALVMHPRLDGTRGKNPGKTGVVTGGLLLAAALWTWFAPQLYPLQLGQEIRSIGGQDYSLNAWPYVVSQAGGAFAMVGAAVVLWGVLLLATRAPSEPEELEAESWAD